MIIGTSVFFQVSHSTDLKEKISEQHQNLDSGTYTENSFKFVSARWHSHYGQNIIILSKTYWGILVKVEIV